MAPTNLTPDNERRAPGEDPWEHVADATDDGLDGILPDEGDILPDDPDDLDPLDLAGDDDYEAVDDDLSESDLDPRDL